jgi:outer membrane murein-binding lipoprotein Lpp
MGNSSVALYRSNQSFYPADFKEMTTEWIAIVTGLIVAVGSALVNIITARRSAHKDEVTSLRTLVDDLTTKYTALQDKYSMMMEENRRANFALSNELSNTRAALSIAQAQIDLYKQQVIEFNAKMDKLTRRNIVLEAAIRQKGIEIPLEDCA